MHTPSVRTRVLSAIVAVLALSACGGGSAPPAEQSAKDTGPAVAVVNGRSLSTQEVKAKLDEQPLFVRSRYATLEKKKEFLDNLIRFELLVQEARKQGLEKDPEIKATLEKVMVQKLLRKQQEAAAGTISEPELRKYFDEHTSEFVKPERVRVSHIFLEAPPADAAKRTQARTTVVKLLADLKTKEAGPIKSAFEMAATQQSQDSATKAAGGDLGFRSREELTQAWGAALADAAFGLKSSSEIGQVVETDKGFHLVKFQSRQVGMNQTFEQAKPRIEARLTGERRSKAMEGFIDGLKAQAKIEVKEDALEQLKIEGAENKPAAPAPTSQPHP
ncbi:peptidyl-prolyl cis-trans isomerase [Myxococcus sp. CA051A]|nr:MULTISPECIES: peptidyl-prolyl cis-trans isomerase [Myxococcus]NTX08934.1 peptidyl-prolyl cis-trans isomerase [Myxococcus sp. CA040A]NTX13678.1 peptidyl-prolyl cis-trans isomerase [Myxococcus sp. CA056]NTX38977.1 peptidyl-prolyl cis-trans isomerase [Myxococcus sp. CA033]NTX53071.1 peptidyl-prolyl cis-trans isomerase [Myxococcus sp. CA039A]NTX62296.1 peptidyl-prolyl cis-trans isomerase [Myxococcus sp. CA051A]